MAAGDIPAEEIDGGGVRGAARKERDQDDSEEAEEEVWRGVTETERAENKAEKDADTKQKKRSRRASLDLLFATSGYKWRSSYCLVFAGGGGDAPRVEVHSSCRRWRRRPRSRWCSG